MSHIEEGKTTIRLTALAAVITQGNASAIAQHPCMALLRQAVTMAAHDQHGVVGTTYADYHYHPQVTNTNLALTIPERLPRGIGLLVHPQTGELSFKGDPWQHQSVFAEVQHAIVQHYVVLAYAAALRRMKAQVSTQIMNDQVVITGCFMAKQRTQLTITVGADGTAHMDFLHFTGSACLDAGHQLHALLADFGVETERTSFLPKPELLAVPASQVVSQPEHLWGRRELAMTTLLLLAAPGGASSPPGTPSETIEGACPRTLYITLGPRGEFKAGTCAHCVVSERGRPSRAWSADGDRDLDFARDTLLAELATLGIQIVERQAYVCP